MYQQSRANEMAMRHLLPPPLPFKSLSPIPLPPLECSSTGPSIHTSTHQQPSPLITTATTTVKASAITGETVGLKRRGDMRTEYVPVSSQTVTTAAPLTIDSALQQGGRIIVSVWECECM